MFKTISIALVSALLINIVGLNLYNLHIEQRFEGQVVTTNYLNDKITKIKSNILELRADSIGSISRADLVDTQNFIEYKVSMNKKSVNGFIDSLNKDMERLNAISNVSQENDEYLQEKIEYLLQEIELLQDKITEPKEIIDVPVFEREVAPVVATPVAAPIPEETNTHIEAYHIEECSYKLESGRQNSTKGIQRTVDSLRKKGTYNISVLFNINTQGQAEELTVKSNTAPSKLERAVQRYVSKLKFVPNETLLSKCEMSFNLNVT